MDAFISLILFNGFWRTSGLESMADLIFIYVIPYTTFRKWPAKISKTKKNIVGWDLPY